MLPPLLSFKFFGQRPRMTLQFFSKHASSHGSRYTAVNTVQTWLWGKNHLPKDLVAALHTLIPELKKETSGECGDE